jgi:hypothetical protein
MNMESILRIIADITLWGRVSYRISERRNHTLPCFLNGQVFRSVSLEFMKEDCVPNCNKLLLQAYNIFGKAIESCLESGGFGRRCPSLSLMVQQTANHEVRFIFTREHNRRK